MCIFPRGKKCVCGSSKRETLCGWKLLKESMGDHKLERYQKKKEMLKSCESLTLKWLLHMHFSKFMCSECLKFYLHYSQLKKSWGDPTSNLAWVHQMPSINHTHNCVLTHWFFMQQKEFYAVAGCCFQISIHLMIQYLQFCATLQWDVCVSVGRSCEFFQTCLRAKIIK